MVGWMQAHAKYVETKINNTLRVSAPLRLCVKLKNKNARSQRRDGAKNKNPSGRDMLLILKWCQLPSNLKRIRIFLVRIYIIASGQPINMLE